MPNHLVSITEGVPDEVRGRALAVRKLEMLPVECVVRGYLTGLGLEGLPGDRAPSPGSRCPRACATPSSSPSRSSRPRRRPTSATTRRSTSTRPRRSWATGRSWSSCATCRSRCTPSPPTHAAKRGVILADTKFEFGRDADGVLRVGDEVLTPDSSRFWPADTYEVGKPQPSFDKQYVRDWASGTGWDKKPPAPAIPDDVVAGTRDALRRGLREDHRPVVRRLARAGGRVNEGARAGPPEGGHPRPAGGRRRARPAGARLRGCRRTSTSAGSSSSTSRTRLAARCRMCREALVNPLIEDYEILEDAPSLDSREVRRHPLSGLV